MEVRGRCTPGVQCAGQDGQDDRSGNRERLKHYVHQGKRRDDERRVVRPVRLGALPHVPRRADEVPTATDGLRQRLDDDGQQGQTVTLRSVAMQRTRTRRVGPGTTTGWTARQPAATRTAAVITAALRTYPSIDGAARKNSAMPKNPDTTSTRNTRTCFRNLESSLKRGEPPPPAAARGLDCGPLTALM